MTTPDTPLSERDLVAATRSGSTDAWNALRDQHEPAVAALAQRRGRDVATATNQAMETLRHGIVESDDDGSGARIRAVRPMALAALTGGDYGPRADASPSDVTDRRIAEAFGRLSTLWQTVLWHRWVELQPAALLATPLGRTPTEVVALEAVAAAGLFDRYLSVVLEEPDELAESCRPVVAQLGGYARNTLPAGERRAIEAHLAALDAPDHQCAVHLGVAGELEARTPPAISPGITGSSVGAYRGIIGAGTGAAGVAAVAAGRTERRIRRARLGAAIGVIVALAGAVFLIRSPVEELATEIADLLDRDDATTTTAPTTTAPTSTTAPASTSTPDGGGDPASQLSNRIEMVFAGALQGIAYVPGPDPLALSTSLSMPAPPYAGGTATVDAAITNTAGDPDIEFFLRVSPGVEFDELVEGAGACEPAPEGGASCRVRIEAGATATMSLRFGLDRELPDRLVVAPNVPSEVLDVEVVELDTLAIGVVDRARGVGGSARFEACEETTCRVRSSIDVDWDDTLDVESAAVVWTAADVAGATFEDSNGGSIALVPDEDLVDPVAVVDVTDLVVAAGPGRYTFAGADVSSAGSWSLFVVIADPDGPRRLLVALHPDVVVAPGSTVEIVVPVASPTGPKPQTDRPLELGVAAAVAPGASLVVADQPLGGDTPFEAQGEPSRTYDLVIGPDDDDLRIEASATVEPYRLSSVSFALDIVT